MRTENLTDILRTNAIPAVMAGIGIWLLVRNTMQDDVELEYDQAADLATVDPGPAVFDEFVGLNPLMAGVAALAVGALLGALIPETAKEHQLLGEARDRLADRAREMAGQGAYRIG